MRSAMTKETSGEAPGKILLGVGVVLALFNFAAALLTAYYGAAFLGMLKTGMWLLGAYAIVGAVVALVLGVRRGKTNWRRSA